MNAKRIALRVVVALIGVSVSLVLVLIGVIALLDRTNGTLTSSGHEREYLLFVPESYDSTTPTPLIISLHGAALWPALQMKLDHWTDLATRHGFIVVYPAGRGMPRAWHGSESAVAEDVRFISELIDTLEIAYNIDSTRIYASGLSNGGRMAFVLSCRLSHRIAAVGTVAAAQELPWRSCGDAGPVPLISFHGTADPIVPYEGGKSWASPRPFPDVPTWTASWARRNRCNGPPAELTVAADVTRFEYEDCADAAAVVLHVVEGGGHTWPGGTRLPEWMAGRTTTSIDATALMWTFFGEHQLSVRPDRSGHSGDPISVCHVG